MELLEGESLRTRLARCGCLSVEDVLRIGRQIALGLDAAHRRGLLHRDIKPDNVWLDADDDQVPCPANRIDYAGWLDDSWRLFFCGSEGGRSQTAIVGMVDVARGVLDYRQLAVRSARVSQSQSGNQLAVLFGDQLRF